MEAVEREVALATDPDQAWTLVSDADELATWLAAEVELTPEAGASGHVVDDDGTRRRLVIDDVVPGERIAWHWWSDDDSPSDRADGADGRSGDAGFVSRVEITLTPLVGGTRVRVVETPLSLPVAAVRAITRMSAGAGGARGATSCVRGRAEVWMHRMLHLELRALVAVAALV